MRLPGRLRPEPILFLLLAVMWGSSYVAIGLVGDDLAPFSLVGARLLIGTLALAAAAVVLRVPRPQRRELAHLVVAGVLGIVIPFTLITWSERSVDAGLASILVAAAPLVSALLVAGTIRDERLGAVRIFGLGLGFLGVVAVAGGGIDAGGDPLALAALLGAAVAYAANGAWSRRFLIGVPPLTAALGQAASGLVVVGVMVVAVERPSVGLPSGEAFLAVAWLGLLSSGVAPLIYFRLLAAWGATRTMAVNYVTPLVGVGAGALVLGEELAPISLVGGALVIVGVGLTGVGGRATDIVGRLNPMRRSRVAPGPVAS
jgi:drug/metabolite transporter (DMT)-like permease